MASPSLGAKADALFRFKPVWKWYYTTWTPSVTARPVSATFNLSQVNNVIPPNLGWDNFPNQVDEVDGAPDYSQEHDVLITLGALSATTIVPDGVNASSYIAGFDAPVISSSRALTRTPLNPTSSSDTINQTIYYPQYVWVDLGPAPISSISIADAPPVVEGTTGPLFATFTVTLSSPPIGDTITVDYATQDGDGEGGHRLHS
jgi:hypothetical protein